MESVDEHAISGKKSKKGKRKGNNGENEDPWAAVGAKRLDAVQVKEDDGGLVGLHDVVLAPPKFSKAPKEKFNGPGKDGKGGMVGLKRQGELSDARRRVVEGYRALMREKTAEKAG